MFLTFAIVLCRCFPLPPVSKLLLFNVYNAKVSIIPEYTKYFIKKIYQICHF